MGFTVKPFRKVVQLLFLFLSKLKHKAHTLCHPGLSLSPVYREPARNRASTHSGGWTPVHDFLMIPELLPQESLNIYWKELKPKNGDCVCQHFQKGRHEAIVVRVRVLKLFLSCIQTGHF